MATTTNQQNNGRLSRNIINLLVTCAILFVSVKVTDGDFIKSIDKITKNLDVALKDLKNDMPDYQNYTDKEMYLSSTVFNPRGMAGLYNLTDKFMGLVLEPDFLMKDLIKFDANANPKLNQNISYTEILKYYWILLAIILILALITVFLPVCGLCFCCCRCCGRCGARSRPADKRRDLCRKVIQGTLLIVLGTGLLFCVVCAFASNQQLEEGIEELPENLKTSRQNVNTYIKSAKHQADLLLHTNYRQFSAVFTNTINKSGEHVMQQLSIWSNATAMTDLNQFVQKIPEIKESLKILKVDTNSLRASASQLNDAMRKVKRDLLNTLTNCPIKECQTIQSDITHLETNIDFNRLPDVSPTINKLNELNFTELKTVTEKGVDALHNIEEQIKNRLNSSLGEALVQVDKAGDQIKTNLDNINKIITDAQTDINKVVDPVIKDADTYITGYRQYRYYGGLAVSCVLLLITVCIVLGLICGICGKRPDGYSDNCCNKGAGGQFLICAVMIIFIFGFVIGVITIVSLALGITTDRVVCYSVRNPDNSKVVDLVDDYLRKSSYNVELNLTVREVLMNCYKNKSIYETVNLKRKFDVDSLSKNFDITQYLNNMTKQLENMPLDIKILDEPNKEVLKKFSALDPSINFDQFQYELKQNFTTLSLNDISDELRKLLEIIGNTEGLASVKAEIQLSILHINTYDEKLLRPMKETAEKVITIAQKLRDDLRMNSSSFSEAMVKLIAEIDDAQTKLQEDGKELLQKAATDFGNIIKNQIDSYINRVVYIAKNEFGQCGPLNLVINATLTATCDKIIVPWNGFWLTLLLSMVLFIPTIIVSVKLANLYQKYKQYGQYVETEYLYDAYADRDNIPLNSRSKRNGKKKQKGKKYEERLQNMGGEVVTREYATGSHPPDGRYSDMAPKHWEEFPNGGPPQYQRAPTEYERPPPYYYPGSGDQ